MNSSRVTAVGRGNNGALLMWRAAGLLLVALLAILAARYLIDDAIPFLTDISSEKFGRFWPRRAWLLTHIIASSLALTAGPFQLWSGPRRRSTLVHRWIGRLYMIGVLVGGCAAFYLASHAGQGPVFAISLGSLGVAWWVTTGMAYVAIHFGHVSQHKEWVLRSYVVTFTFVSTRSLADLGVLPSLGHDPFATLVWLCWTLPLLGMEVILQGRKVLARGEGG